MDLQSFAHGYTIDLWSGVHESLIQPHGQLSYHIVTAPKYRYAQNYYVILAHQITKCFVCNIFSDSEIRDNCKQIFHEILEFLWNFKASKSLIYVVAEQYSFVIYALKVMPDHVHLFVGFKSSMSVSRVVRLWADLTM